MKSLYLSITLSLAMLSSVVIAQEVSVEVAKSRTLDFLSGQSAGPMRAKGQNPSSDLTLAYTSESEGKTCFYVFNIGNDKGFVIAGGDEAANEILGYCDHGSFDYDTAPENFKWWLSQYTDQIAHSSTSAATRAPRRAQVTTTRANIEPLIQTKWHQEEPFNNAIPRYNGDSVFITGCVATAMAQVMYRYRCPATNGTGSKSYQPETYSSMTLSADFVSTTYDWDNMLERYTHGAYTQAQADAVATLMYHAGVAVSMDYNTDAGGGSGAYSSDIGPALVNYFKYDKSVRNEYRAYYSDEEWEDLIYAELEAGRPVMYSGQSDQGGHQFICDGYDRANKMYTFNWGWGGRYDGSYPLAGTGALQPTESGMDEDDARSPFDQQQMITINVKPDEGGNESAHLAQVDNMYLLVEGGEYEENYEHIAGRQTTADLCLTLYNLSCLTTYFDFGVKVTEKATGITYYWTDPSCTNKRILYMYYYPGLSIPFDLNDLQYNGVYEVRPVCRKTGLSDEDWTEVDLTTSETIPTITVTEGVDPSVDVNFSVESNSVEVGRKLQIEHNEYYNGSVTYSTSDENVATVDADGVITGVSLGTATITAEGASDGYFHATTKTFEITVTELIKDNIIFSISKTKLSLGKTLKISWPEDYDGTVSFETSIDGIVNISSDGMVTGLAEGTVTITVIGESSNLYNMTTKAFKVTVVDINIEILEQPNFNNDNNPYYGDFLLYMGFAAYSALETVPVPIIYEIKNENGDSLFKESFELDSIPSNRLINLLFNFEWLDNLFEANKKYTIHFYRDTEFKELYDDNSSVTFTYRNSLTVNHNVSPAGYGTIILPFNAELPDDMKVYSCTAVDANGVLTLTEDTDIRRNVPYIITGTYGTTYQFVGPEAIDEETPSFTDNLLVGAVTNTVPLVSNTDYILQVQNDKAAFYKYTGTKSADASENDSDGNRLATQFRAFIRLNNTHNATKLRLPGMEDDETEGIETIKNEVNLPAGIYSIDGKRMTEFQKGLNIIVTEDGKTLKVIKN